MSIFLTHAKGFEQKSKEHLQRTEQTLQSAFSEHARSVVAELNESERRISNAILDHERNMEEAMGRISRSVMGTAVRIILGVLTAWVFLVAGCGSVLWLQGSWIADNAREMAGQQEDLRRQQEDLSRMDGKTWGVTHQKSADGQRYLVMPKGTKPQVFSYDGAYWVRMEKE